VPLGIAAREWPGRGGAEGTTGVRADQAARARNFPRLQPASRRWSERLYVVSPTKRSSSASIADASALPGRPKRSRSGRGKANRSSRASSATAATRASRTRPR